MHTRSPFSIVVTTLCPAAARCVSQILDFESLEAVTEVNLSVFFIDLLPYFDHPTPTPVCSGSRVRLRMHSCGGWNLMSGTPPFTEAGLLLLPSLLWGSALSPPMSLVKLPGPDGIYMYPNSVSHICIGHVLTAEPILSLDCVF